MSSGEDPSLICTSKKKNEEDFVVVDLYQNKNNGCNITPGGSLEKVVEVEIEDNVDYSFLDSLWLCLGCRRKGGTRFEKIRLGEIPCNTVNNTTKTVVQNAMYDRDVVTDQERAERISKKISEGLKKGTKVAERTY
jgi:hypothetical protein